MPTNHSDNEGDEKPKTPVSRRGKNTPLINVTVNSGVNQTSTENSEGNENNPDHNGVTVNVVNPENNTAPQVAANKIANRAFLANIVIMGCTIILAAYAIKQAISAESAAKIAQSTLDTTRRYDSIALANQKITSRKSDSLDSIKFKADTLANGAQHKYFEAAKNEFDIENRPFLQIKNVSIDSSMRADNYYNDTYQQVWRIKFDIFNAGKQPFKITSGDYDYMVYPPPINPEYFFNKKGRHDATGIVVSGQSKDERHIIMPDVNKTYYLMMTVSTRASIILFGDLKYESVFTKKKYHYHFVDNIVFSPEIELQSLKLDEN